MKLNKDIALSHDFVVYEGSKVDNIEDKGIEPADGLIKAEVKKEYKRAGVTIYPGSNIGVGEYRLYQLTQAGIVSSDEDTSKAVSNHKAKSQRVKKEDKPQVVEHKITE